MIGEIVYPKGCSTSLKEEFALEVQSVIVYDTKPAFLGKELATGKTRIEHIEHCTTKL